MAANMDARNVAGNPPPHVELEMTRAALQDFAMRIIHDLVADPGAATFHLQVQAQGIAPVAGAVVPPGGAVTVTVHPFPQA